MKKIISIVLVLTMSLSVLVGCGNNEKTSENNEKTVENNEKTPEKVKLEGIFYFSEAEADANSIYDAFFRGVNKYKDTYPEVELDFEYIPYGSYEQKLNILAAGGNLPDVFQLKGQAVSNFVENERLLNLNYLFENDEKWAKSFKENANDNFIVDNNNYGVVQDLGGTTSLIFYNKEILKEAGYTEFPETMPEFIQMTKDINKVGYTPIAMGNKGAWVAQSCYISALAGLAGGNDWVEGLVKGENKFTDKEFILALETLQQLAKEGAFNSDLNSIDNAQQKTVYYNKKSAMFVEGGWAVQDVITNAPQDVLENTGIAYFPAIESGKGKPDTLTGGPAGWSISVNSKLENDDAKKVAVENFIKMVVSDESAKYIYEHGRVPSTNVDSYDTSALQPLQVRHMTMESEGAMTRVLDSMLSAQVIEVMNSGLQELLIDVVTPEELANRIQTEMDKIAE